jgi:hypothetical protein
MHGPPLVFEAGAIRTWRRVLGALSLLAIAVCIVALLAGTDDAKGAIFTAAVLALSCAFVALILPSRYELSASRLDLVFRLWRWSLDLETVEWAAPARWWQAYGYYGFRFATNPNQAIVIKRRQPSLFRRPNLVISPADRGAFLISLRQLNPDIEVSDQPRS